MLSLQLIEISGYAVTWQCLALNSGFLKVQLRNTNSEVTYIENLIWPLITSFIRAESTLAADHMLWPRDRVTLILFSD